MTMDWQTVSGRTISDEIIPARAGWSRELKQGEVLRLVDLEGRQAVDFLCYNARDHEDRYAAADTMKINGNIFIGKGTVLYSVNCNPLLTVVEDTLGFHDTIVRAGGQRRRHGHGAQHFPAGRLRGPSRGDGRAGGGVQLPADEQPGERLQPDAGAGNRIPALKRDQTAV